MALAGDGGFPVRRTLAGLVAVLAIAVFLPVRNYEWLNYDDNVYITECDEVRSGWNLASVAWAFSSFDGANWFPLTRLSWMLDVELHGLDAGGFHVTNVLLHALTSLVLFLALSELTRSPLRSAFVAAIFAVHPLHVESVAWISARKDPLSGLFWMLSLYFYARERRRGASFSSRLALFVCLALGLMAKPVLVTLPFALLLLDAWPLRRLRSGAEPPRWDRAKLRKAVVEKLPLFALVAGSSIVTFLAQRSGEAVATLAQVPLAIRVENALSSYVAYLRKAFWPVDLAVFYPHAGDRLDPGDVALATAILLALSIGVWLARRSRPYLGVGWLWFLGTLVPMIGLVQIGSQGMADRYMYIPLVGLALAVTWGAADALAKWRGGRVALAIGAAATIAALTFVTSEQLRNWRDSATLFRHALMVTPENPIAHAYLGTALLERGQTGDAIVQYKEALRLRPDFLTVANNLAWLLATSHEALYRDPRAAVEIAEDAARLSGYEDPAVLDTLAAAYAAAHRFDDARSTLQRGIEISRVAGDAATVEEFEQRLDLYRALRPYVEPPH